MAAPLVVFSLCSVAVILLDNQRSGLGFEVGDNAALMIRFLEQRVDILHQHRDRQRVGGVSLALAAIPLWEILSKEQSLLLKYGTLAAFAASAFFFVNGVHPFGWTAIVDDGRIAEAIEN